MENSIRKSNSTQNEKLFFNKCSNDDIKVFIKLTSRPDNSLYERVFFFEENREVLLLQKGNESLRKYKYDYIFSDYENTTLISNSIKGIISNLIHNDKNVCFFTFGEEKLGIINIK
jgi:hypothetical protein